MITLNSLLLKNKNVKIQKFYNHLQKLERKTKEVKTNYEGGITGTIKEIGNKNRTKNKKLKIKSFEQHTIGETILFEIKESRESKRCTRLSMRNSMKRQIPKRRKEIKENIMCNSIRNLKPT